jgi:hypothetical protein
VSALTAGAQGGARQAYVVRDDGVDVGLPGAVVDAAAAAGAASLPEKQTRDLIVGHVDVYGETVLVAVPSNSQVRLFDLDGKPGRILGMRGTAACTLAFPTAAALAGDDELVIVDQQRMLVLRWSIPSNRCLGEYIGLGDAPGYLYYPMDLALDGKGQLFVAQGFEGRVQMYRGMTPAPAPAAPGRATP